MRESSSPKDTEAKNYSVIQVLFYFLFYFLSWWHSFLSGSVLRIQMHVLVEGGRIDYSSFVLGPELYNTASFFPGHSFRSYTLFLRQKFYMQAASQYLVRNDMITVLGRLLDYQAEFANLRPSCLRSWGRSTKVRKRCIYKIRVE